MKSSDPDSKSRKTDHQIQLLKIFFTFKHCDLWNPYLKKFCSVIIAGGLTYSTLAQTSPCGPIVQNFNIASNGMAGFTSSTLNSTAEGFTYISNGQNNGFLERCNISSGRSVYEIVTPTYQSFPHKTLLAMALN